MLTLEEKVRCLGSGIFRDVDEDARAAIAERMGERKLADGEHLFLSGETGGDVFVVVSGAIEIRHGETVIAVAGPGQSVGELAVLGAGGRRSAGARAKGPTLLLFLKEQALKLLICDNPDIAFALFGSLTERLMEANELNVFLAGARTEVGRAEIVSGDAAGQRLPLYRRRAVLGRGHGSLGDALRVAVRSSDPELRDRHAAVTVEDDTVFVEPLEGAVLLNGDPVAHSVAIGPRDEVSIGALRIRFVLGTAGEGVA